VAQPEEKLHQEEKLHMTSARDKIAMHYFQLVNCTFFQRKNCTRFAPNVPASHGNINNSAGKAGKLCF